ncbi:MAG: Lrp/AsnC ligand binding domain-containing protein [candidate division WOR-3 bacterium]
MVGAYLLINTDTGKEADVVEALNKISGVKNAHIVTGLHDVICYVEGKDLSEVKQTIVSKIRGIKGIQRTVTCIAIDVSK